MGLWNLARCLCEPYGEWSTWVMRGWFPRVVPPVGSPAGDLAPIDVPVLIFPGDRRRLHGGSLAKAAEVASVMGNLRTVVLEPAHLVDVEAAGPITERVALLLEQDP